MVSAQPSAEVMVREVRAGESRRRAHGDRRRGRLRHSGGTRVGVAGCATRVALATFGRRHERKRIGAEPAGASSWVTTQRAHCRGLIADIRALMRPEPAIAATIPSRAIATTTTTATTATVVPVEPRVTASTGNASNPITANTTFSLRPYSFSLSKPSPQNNCATPSTATGSPTITISPRWPWSELSATVTATPSAISSMVAAPISSSTASSVISPGRLRMSASFVPTGSRVLQAARNAACGGRPVPHLVQDIRRSRAWRRSRPQGGLARLWLLRLFGSPVTIVATRKGVS
jgi:hypothetical protein